MKKVKRSKVKKAAPAKRAKAAKPGSLRGLQETCMAITHRLNELESGFGGQIKSLAVRAETLERATVDLSNRSRESRSLASRLAALEH
jgi:hypothetical protein